jgi:hypothetical protein
LAFGIRHLAFGIRHSASGIRVGAFGILVIAASGCGKKGPPLPPLVIVPGPVSEVSASRIGDRVRIRFMPPAKNTDNSTPADVERIDMYALSAESTGESPEAGVVIKEGSLVGSIELPKPAASADGEQPTGPRTFNETITTESLKLWKPKEPPSSDRAGGRAASVPPSPAPTAATAATTPATSAGTPPSGGSPGPAGLPGGPAARVEAKPQPMRLYALVPVSARGRRGPASLVSVPLVPSPPPVASPVVTYTEKAVALVWVAVDGAAGYNVYETVAAGSPVPAGPPLNESPLKEPKFEDTRVELGKARCYSVTAVEIVQERRIESVTSAPACVTPVDTFAPPAPTGVAAVASPGAMSLIWDPVSASDLAGYVVLRGEAPGDTLQALTPEPIKESTFRDATVTTGTRYVYAVVAVDTAGNMSAQSSKVEETAR